MQLVSPFKAPTEAMFFLLLVWSFLLSCITSVDTAPLPPYEAAVGLEYDVSALRAAPEAPAWYINSRTGNDDADGRSPGAAWKSLDRLHSQRLGPGDVVRLARGSLWEKQCLFFDNGSAGTAKEPIIIEAYGEGPLPHIREPRALWDKTLPWAGVSFGRDRAQATASSHIRLLEVHVSDIAQPAIAMSGETSHITVAGCEVSNAAMGVAIRGEYQQVIGCHVHDGVMAVDTGDGATDWGANGVGVMGKHQVISWNRFTRCRAPSKAFGSDGGAVEFFGYDSDTGLGWDYVCEDIAIHHNVIDDSNGLIEALGKVSGLVIAYNLYYNSPTNPIIFHLNTIRDDAWYEALVAHNTFDCPDTNGEGWGLVGLLVDWDNQDAAILSQTNLTVRNNIFVTNYAVMSWINPIGGNLVHDHNLVSLVDGGMLSVNNGIWSAEGELLGAPLFASPLSARQKPPDYRPLAASPARGAGTTIPLPGGWASSRAFDTDLAGIPYGHGAIDIGAFAVR